MLTLSNYATQLNWAVLVVGTFFSSSVSTTTVMQLSYLKQLNNMVSSNIFTIIVQVILVLFLATAVPCEGNSGDYDNFYCVEKKITESESF